MGVGKKNRKKMHNWHNPIVAPRAAAVNTNVAEISGETPSVHRKAERQNCAEILNQSKWQQITLAYARKKGLNNQCLDRQINLVWLYT